MELAIWIMSIIILSASILIAISVWSVERKLDKFESWLRHNNPGGYVDMTMGNGKKYRIKIDKE